MHRFPDGIVATECERKVGHSSGSQSSGKILLYPAHCINVIHPETRMPVNAGAYRKYVAVEYDVRRRNPGLFRQERVTPRTNLYFSGKSLRLPLFVEGHHHHSCAKRMDFTSPAQEFVLSVLEGYGVYDRPSGNVPESFGKCIPVGGIQHYG